MVRTAGKRLSIIDRAPLAVSLSRALGSIYKKKTQGTILNLTCPKIDAFNTSRNMVT